MRIKIRVMHVKNSHFSKTADKNKKKNTDSKCMCKLSTRKALSLLTIFSFTIYYLVLAK